MKNDGVIDFKARMIRYDLSINLLVCYQVFEHTKVGFPWNGLYALCVLFFIGFYSAFAAKWSANGDS